MGDCSEEKARHHIDRIARLRQEGSTELKDSLAGALHRVTMMFPETGHFLMEFLQNADDADSTSVLIELTPEAVRIANNGVPFSESDVESICRVGRSTKRATEYIGYLGIGFKSVFLFCDSPRIVSGCYRFTFDRHHWPRPETIPWQITPIWLDRRPEWVKTFASYTTFFELPLRQGYEAAIVERLRSELRPDGFSARALLFLRRVQDVVLRDRLDGTERVVRRRQLTAPGGPADPYEVYEIADEQDGAIRTERWVVFRSTISVPEEVRMDWATLEWDRHDVATREIAAAFGLDEAGQLQSVAGTAHMGVFSFLPLKEVPSGLPFLVQGDFLTGPGRETIRRDALWNRWMARELFRFITERVVPALLNHEEWRYVAAAVLYPGQGGPDVISEELIGPLRRYVEGQPLLATADGSFVTPGQALRIPNWDAEWFQVLGVAKVESLFPGKKVLHPRTHHPWQLTITGGPFVNSKHWPSVMQRLVEARAQEKDTEFFKALFRELGKYQDPTIRRAPWSSAPIVLAEDGTLVTASSAYWAENGPKELQGLRRVHPDIWADPACAEFLQILGCQILTSEEVKERQILGSLVQQREKWAALSSEERITWTGRFFRAWQEGLLRPQALEFLTVKTLEGHWRPPGDVFFSHAFAPDHRLEVLAARGLLKAEPGELPLLSGEYLGLGYGSIYEWRRFFQEIGVDRRLVDERRRDSFAERVAEEVLIRYEQRRGCQPTRVPRSQERGYDFESGGRRIELKGRSRPEPSMDLTRTQYQALRDNRYYVYVVADALCNPVLYVLQGAHLLELVPEASFPHAQWHGLAEDRYVALEGEGETRDARSR